MINFTNKEILPNKYQDIIPAGKNKFIVKENDKFNIVESDKDGNTELEKRTEKKLSKDYTSIEYYEAQNIYVATLDGKEEVYDADLNLKLENITVLKIADDYIKIKENTGEKTEKLYNFKFDEIDEKKVFKNNNLIRFKENGKFGFKDVNGSVIVAPIYDDASYQNEYGFIAVNRDRKMGST